MAKGGETGRGFPVTVGSKTDKTLTMRSTAIPPRPRGGSPCFIDTDPLSRIKGLLGFTPGRTGFSYGLTLLLSGAQRFFYG